MDRWTLEIDRGDIRRAWLTDEPQRDPGEGEIEFAIDLVALTANNVTYAALGQPTGFLGPDAGYWDFFAERGEAGRLPVWGFATVLRSRVPGIQQGEQFYGYWPLASHAVLQSDRTTAVGFVETSTRRAKLPGLYNGYQRVAALPDHRAADHSQWPVWRPLYLTGWLVADQLEDEGDHGAAQVLVTAASSKTALSFAHAMQAREQRPRLVALTSARSVDFVRATGLYDTVLSYDALSEVALEPSALIDFANAAAVVAGVREILGDRLRFDLVVGATHWDATQGPKVAGVPRSAFFAPDRLTKRGREWGDALRDRLAAAWTEFMTVAPTLTRLQERTGAEAALAAWDEAVSGRADPALGVLLRPAG